MRKILVAMVIAALSVAPALAEPASPKQPDQSAAASMPTPKRAGPNNPCSVYGPGFIKVEGSETCLKIGGAVSVGAGGSIGSH
jgi:hypothetical protein